MRIAILALVCLLPSLSCSSNTMEQTRYSGGKVESVIYTKYYDDGAWLEDGALGLQIVIEHDHRSIPILGTMTLGDLQANGKVTIVIWNFQTRSRTVTINKTTNLHRNQVASGPYTVEAVGQNQSRIEVGSFQIFNYATEIKVVVEYEIDGVNGSKQLAAKRRTDKEMAAYFGPQGKPPYPWFSTRQ